MADFLTRRMELLDKAALHHKHRETWMRGASVDARTVASLRAAIQPTRATTVKALAVEKMVVFQTVPTIKAQAAQHLKGARPWMKAV